MISKLLGKNKNFWMSAYLRILYRRYIVKFVLMIRSQTTAPLPPPYLDGFGYNVYSQNDEDGIINEIFKRIGTTNKTFVEFGVQDGLESNGHFLLFSGWRGLWIDGSKKNIKKIEKKFPQPLSTKQLTAVNAMVTAENINDLIGKNGFNGEIDLLSIDIDGNDYWVWQAIKCVDPRVVVIEYNAKFPPDCEWIMEYNPGHIWDRTDNFGTSLKSLELLGAKLGYRLVGTNINGVNAFFVKSSLAKELFAEPATAENLCRALGAGFPKFFNVGHPNNKYIGNKHSTKKY
ncbi:MAG: hypothetical protein LBI42_10875 [Chitinispirillales bacterium]|jgi:hypothetical protein|nr:hypothetical protein [Chitinispirillales bacterium]